MSSRMRIIRTHQWTNAERLELLKICSDEMIEKDWTKRAETMQKRLKASAIGYFFTAKVCHAEIERILSSPCPGIEPNTSGQYSYSHKVLMEKWMIFYNNEIEEEKRQKTELAMIEARRCTSLIEKILADKMSTEEMRNLLEQMKMENPKREDDIQFKRVVSTYSNRLIHLWKECGNTKIDLDDQLKATVPSEDNELQSLGLTTPIPSLPPSVLSSPIRSVADAMKDAIPIFVEPESPAPVIHASPMKQSTETEVKDEETNDEGIEEEMYDEDEEVIDEELDDIKDIEPEPEPETPRQRGRPRLSTAKIHKVASSELLTSNAETTGKLKRNSESSDGAKKKPPIVQTKKETRQDSDDKKSVRSIDSFEIPSAPLTPMPSEWKEVSSQTAVSVRSAFRASTPIVEAHRRRTVGGSGTTPLRKSSRRSELVKPCASPIIANTISCPPPSSSSSDRMINIGTQTGRVEFEKDDVVTMTYCCNPQAIPEIITLDKKKEKKKSVDCSAGTSSDKEDEADEPTRRGSKSESRKEIPFVIDTDDVTAQALIETKGYRETTTSETGVSIPGESPIKRMRKDEKAREEATVLKQHLNCMWRVLSDHKHSAIFSHPVTEKDAPGYTETIKSRVDLAQIKREIENGTISSKTCFLLKSYNMYSNAIMFNSTGHDVNSFARNTVRDVMNDILITADERKPLSLRRGKIIDEARSSQRAQSLEPQPILHIGIPGSSRSLFKRKNTSGYIKKLNQK